MQRILFIANSALFPAVEAIHLIGLAILIGSIVLVDLRILGLGIHTVSAGGLRRRLGIWRRSGLVISVATGLLLFLSDAGRYLSSPVFLVKIAVLGIAIASYHRIHARPSRIAAALSLALWMLVVLTGRGQIDWQPPPLEQPAFPFAF